MRVMVGQQSFRGIRSSKFKHVYGSPAKKEKCYDNISITKNAHDSQFCAVNPKFIAIVTESSGGGCFIVMCIEATGRQEFEAGKVVGHRGPVLDIKWNPFNDNIIASCSDDCTVKLWQIPDSGPPRRGISDAIVTLSEHRRRVGLIEWHPTAENILVSAGFDLSLIVWHTSKAQPIRIINCHPDSILSMSFNRDGSFLATTCKDKRLRIIEPRRGEVLNSGICHEGSKSCKVVYLGESGRLFTTGFSRFSDRQWAVWEQTDLQNPLRLENIDSSSGVLFPFYDHDTKMVYVAGKGDGSIRYYEITSEAPFCYYINQFMTGFPQRGLGVMPKRGLNPSLCEIFRFYKLHATRNICEPVSMIVPRKCQLFQTDLFPDTAAPTPAMSAEEWIAGKNRYPILMSMKSQLSNAKTYKPIQLSRSATTNGTNGHDHEHFAPVSSSLNNNRKFIYLTEENRIDYRPKPLPRSDSQEILRPSNAPHSVRQRNAQNRFSGWPISSGRISGDGSPMNGKMSPGLQSRVKKCYSAVNLFMDEVPVVAAEPDSKKEVSYYNWMIGLFHADLICRSYKMLIVRWRSCDKSFEKRIPESATWRRSFYD
jgi:coronin-2